MGRPVRSRKKPRLLRKPEMKRNKKYTNLAETVTNKKAVPSPPRLIQLPQKKRHGKIRVKTAAKIVMFLRSFVITVIKRATMLIIARS